MKKVIITVVGLMFCAGLICNAAPKMTPEQRKERQELVKKYDTDKDKKLSAEEIAKMSADDKKKWEELSPAKKAK